MKYSVVMTFKKVSNLNFYLKIPSRLGSWLSHEYLLLIITTQFIIIIIIIIIIISKFFTLAFVDGLSL